MVMAENLVQVDLVTPEKHYASVDATLVEVPGTSGDFGVLPGHSPLISTIRPGVVTIHVAGGEKQRYVVLGGISEVTTERCTILAEYLEDASAVSREQAEKRLASARTAQNNAFDDQDKRAAERELKVAEALVSGLVA
jgi:F-type H+-transporting ATPase subunit epsilon